MVIQLSEHKTFDISIATLTSEYQFHESIVSKSFNKNNYKFQIERSDAGLCIKADYCIGVDWLGNTGRYLHIEPKINSSTLQSFIEKIGDEKAEPIQRENGESFELDYLQMLMLVTSIPEGNKETADLVKIDWDSKLISIGQKADHLTPFLIVRFLQTLKSIVRKGLKKNFYKVKENVNNRVKGKILVGSHIRKNVFKNRMTSTFCEYQVFGEDHTENRLLKKVLNFVISYVENHQTLLSSNYRAIQDCINFCRPAFAMVSEDVSENELKYVKPNPFYKDYIDALRTGSYILKRFAYNITTTSSQQVSTPPFWIDMPKLFELYVYSKMIEDNRSEKLGINYQFSTYGNALDILISHPKYKMVVDAKYKLYYRDGHVHDDIRQVAGYSRLDTVREKLGVQHEDKHIDCLIIYPDMLKGAESLSFETIKENWESKIVKGYYKVYKLGVKLPWIKKDEACTSR